MIWFLFWNCLISCLQQLHFKFANIEPSFWLHEIYLSAVTAAVTKPNISTLEYQLFKTFNAKITKREQNHSSDSTAWCSGSGKGGTTNTTLFDFSFIEEEEEESLLSLLEVLLTSEELVGRSCARCAWAQVEQTADKVRSSSLQSTPLCGQYTLLDRRLSISLSSPSPAAASYCQCVSQLLVAS